MYTNVKMTGENISKRQDALAIKTSENQIIFFLIDDIWLKMVEIDGSYAQLSRKWKNSPCGADETTIECFADLDVATAIELWTGTVAGTSTDLNYEAITTNLPDCPTCNIS